MLSAQLQSHTQSAWITIGTSISARGSRTGKTANGTVIVKKFCGCAIALGTRRWMFHLCGLSFCRSIQILDELTNSMSVDNAFPEARSQPGDTTAPASFRSWSRCFFTAHYRLSRAISLPGALRRTRLAKQNVKADFSTPPLRTRFMLNSSHSQKRGHMKISQLHLCRTLVQC